MTLSLASIHIYPIKSIGGFAAEEARLTDRGLEHDRRWMLVDAGGRFITQREVSAMACLHGAPNATGFTVTDTRNHDRIELPWTLDAGDAHRAMVWSDAVEVIHAPEAMSSWFAQRLDIRCSLVYMPDSAQRPVDAHYATGSTSLSDGFPYLIISEASLDDLNNRLSEPVPMDRFRPNLVIAGGVAHQEDTWRSIRIGSARFELVKPCGRCVITTTDQRSGERGAEPLRTLAGYRTAHGKVLFGMNAVGHGRLVRVGDLVAP
ncbi:MAG: MOSC domain-containing protein [Flavobacteriales bacterium]|nr:MOSC domain-containing protein [Flavobacteriales bacterium]